MWTRILLSDKVQQKFTQVAEGYIDTLRSDTEMVALRYELSCTFSNCHCAMKLPVY